MCGGGTNGAWSRGLARISSAELDAAAMAAPKVPYVTPEQVEEALARPGCWVALPIADSDAAAELVNRVLDAVQGEQET